LNLNPEPWADPDGHKDRYGWDFVSEDSRPYDDGYHGTQIASLVVSVAPQAKIMPLKIFNPWGITTSAAIYGAFIYAVDHGAQVIVCGWSTPVNSQALQRGVTYAHDHGVVVVTASGDLGVNLATIPAYPAVLARTFDNVVSVTGVDVNDQLEQVSGKAASFDPTSVKIAAPGQDIEVAEPRLGETRTSSTGLAAAIVAGAVARVVASDNLSGTYQEWIQTLLSEADSVPGLDTAVQGGLRLHIRH
jgi:subtilisin family serine protease